MKYLKKKFQVIKPTQINILFAGRFEYQKGVDQMIAVVSALKDDSRFYFHVVGSGSMEPKVITAFKGLTNVTVYQKVFGLAQYIGSFDYLFMPSNHEGLALMPIEASLAYTPTIINNCPGLKDTLPEDWPLCVNNNSKEEFIRLISSLPESINYTELANKAHNFAQAHFTLKKNATKI
ncbi:glycosyltransferase [Bacteroides fragilis]